MGYVQVWVDDTDALENCSNSEIEREYKRRKNNGAFGADDLTDVDELYAAIEHLERGDNDYALFLLRQIVRPKFSSVDGCKTAYDSIMNDRKRRAAP